MTTPIRLNSNPASDRSRRMLSRATDEVSSVYERLSSGQRINRAADDAAGLSVSSSLRSDARVYTQAIRNLNDGVSLVAIATGALQQLSQISTRQLELATQAANGVYSSTQRQALDTEANQLVKEFNRIVQSTSFNGVRLFEGSPSDGIRIQAGYGVNGSINLKVGEKFARTVSDGTFKSVNSVTTSGISNPWGVVTTDINGDGNLDFITADFGTQETISTFLGNGDGTFRARITSRGYDDPRDIALADFNKDNKLDLVITEQGGNAVTVFFGNGNGTFWGRRSYATGTTPRELTVADFNNDGYMDVASADTAGSSISVFLNRGDGTMNTRISVAITSLNPQGLGSADVNNDGIPDLAVGDSGGGGLAILLGNGNGTFVYTRTYSPASSSPLAMQFVDINHDGKMDMVSGDSLGSTVSVFIGNGDGSFKARISSQVGATPRDIKIDDFNGDGYYDIASVNEGPDTVSVLLGNGDGTFQAQRVGSVTGGADPRGLALGDFNNDGAIDVVSAEYNGSSYSILLSNPVKVMTMPQLDLLTQDNARSAIPLLNKTLERISQELGALGSYENILSTAERTLSINRENYLTAASRITDADVAEETSTLVRKQIVQKAGAMVLAQANQQPALALQLLSSV